MIDAGTAPPLVLRVECTDGMVSSATVTNRRPQAARTLIGRSAAEAAALVPRLFALCAHAQGTAARLACAAAAGEAAPDIHAALLTERQLAAECAQEHLWRLLLDWPPLFALEPRRNRYAELHRRLARPQEAEAAFALGGELLDLVARDLLAGFFHHAREPRNLAELSERAAAGGNLGSVLADLIGIGAFHPPAAKPVAPLPRLGAAAWAAHFDGLPDASFCAAPTFAGEPAETGPLARHHDSRLVELMLHHGHRISARLLAKVVDLADCGSRLRHPLAPEVPALADAVSLTPGIGFACVETARGTLMHGVRLENGTIADYAICAPTEWNFHPAGSFVREAVGSTADTPQAMDLRLRALILALDPCVDYQLEITERVHA